MLAVCDRDSLRSVEQAIAALQARITQLPRSEIISLKHAAGRVLREPITASLNVPAWDNSAMDGYAFNFAQAQAAGFSLPVSGRIIAGDTEAHELLAHTAVRIFTGAPLPAGADTVAAQEDCQLDEQQQVMLPKQTQGQHVRYQAEELKIGQPVLAQGTMLRAQEIGLLASLGYSEVQVYRPLRVGLISSGNELRELGESLEPGQIYDVNRYSIGSLLEGWGFDLQCYGIMPDHVQASAHILAEAAAENDVLISTAGVSVGEEDHLKAAIEQLGELHLWRVAIQPGKPLAFGEVRDTPWVGLPGNPAAAFVTALIIARPFLRQAQGVTTEEVLGMQLPADFSSTKQRPRRQYLRAKLQLKQNASWVSVHPNQGSAMLTAASWADGLALVEANSQVHERDLVTFIPFSQLVAL